MFRKILIQLLLFVILFAIIGYTFFSYFKKKDNLKDVNIENIGKIEPQIDEDTGTVIKDLRYSFTDLKGNVYLLVSKFGEVDLKNPDKIFMTNVIATINLVDTEPIKIVSKHANYNKSSHETSFFENVVVTHLMHNATSDNLDISFINNIATMYNNVIYNKPGTELIADKLEIDLITKNSRIYMYNEYERIKIIDKQ